MLKRRSKISTRFIISTAVVFSLIVILFTFSFLYILKINSGILREILFRNNDLYYNKKISLIIERLHERDIRNIRDLSGALDMYCSKDNDFLYIIIYSKSPDENFFKVKKKIPIDPALQIDAERNELVQEKKDTNYLKTAVTKLVIDPKIYVSGSRYYKTVYNPFILKGEIYIIEFFVSSSEIMTAFNDYSDKINDIKKYAVISGSSVILIVIITILIFTYNFSLLVKNISGHVRKAVEGTVEIDKHTDDDIHELAYSFNDIVSELRSKKDSAENMFRMGVGLMKENNFNDAIAVFKTLSILKPDSFGSYFNLGVAYARIKQYDASYSMFGKALEYNPGHPLTIDYMTKVKRLQDMQKTNGKNLG